MRSDEFVDLELCPRCKDVDMLPGQEMCSFCYDEVNADRIDAEYWEYLDDEKRLEKIAGEEGGQYMWAVWQTDPEYHSESLYHIYDRKDEAERDAARLTIARIERVMVIWNPKVVNGK